MTELITFNQGYKIATQNYMRRYFDSLRNAWDGKPRIQYLLPHFMRTPQPFEAAWRFSAWLTDYVDTVYNGAREKEHYVLDFTGYDSNTMVLMMKQLNPIKRVNIGYVQYNSKYFADIAADNGILTDTNPTVSEEYAKDENIAIDDEMLNLLDHLPVAIARAVKQCQASYRNGRLTHLTIKTNNDYGRGKKRALQNNMKRITDDVRNQIWAEAVYLYFDQLNDHVSIVSGYAVDADMDPTILYD